MDGPIDKRIVEAREPRLEAKVLQETGIRAAVATEKHDPLAVIQDIQDRLNCADRTVECVRGEYEHATPLREYTR